MGALGGRGSPGLRRHTGGEKEPWSASASQQDLPWRLLAGKQSPQRITKITIVDLHNEVTELATNLVNGGSIDNFVLPQRILDQVDNEVKFIFLTRKRDNLKTLLQRKPQKLQEAPSRSALSADTIQKQPLQFHSNRDDTSPQKSRSDATIIAGPNIPPLDVHHALLDISSGLILPHRRAHEDNHNVTV